MAFLSDRATSLRSVLENVIYFLLRLIPFKRNGWKERLTINEELSLRKLLRIIQAKTNYRIYCEAGVLQEASRPVIIVVREATVKEILDMALVAQPESFSYIIHDHEISILRGGINWQVP
jgi:hypothetical protein